MTPEILKELALRIEDAHYDFRRLPNDGWVATVKWGEYTGDANQTEFAIHAGFGVFKDFGYSPGRGYYKAGDKWSHDKEYPIECFDLMCKMCDSGAKGVIVEYMGGYQRRECSVSVNQYFTEVDSKSDHIDAPMTDALIKAFIAHMPVIEKRNSDDN